MTKLLTLQQYADQEKVGIEAIRMRIRRGTCFTKWKGDIQYVFVEKDKTIKKPRGNRLRRGWIPIEEEKPIPKQRVYIVCENKKFDGNIVRFQTIAEYIPYMTIKESDYMSDEYHGEGDYNESEDEYYTPEGFYEWQSEPDINWKISVKVTHWMRLINLP